MQDNRPKKTIVVARNEMTVMPSTDSLIADALGIIRLELLKFRRKVDTGKSLDLAEGRLLNGYVKSLVEMSKEDRERAKDSDLSKLTTEQLIELLQGTVKSQQALEEGNKNARAAGEGHSSE